MIYFHTLKKKPLKVMSFSITKKKTRVSLNKEKQ